MYNASKIQLWHEKEAPQTCCTGSTGDAGEQESRDVYTPLIDTVCITRIYAHFALRVAWQSLLCVHAQSNALNLEIFSLDPLHMQDTSKGTEGDLSTVV